MILDKKSVASVGVSFPEQSLSWKTDVYDICVPASNSLQGLARSIETHRVYPVEIRGSFTHLPFNQLIDQTDTIERAYFANVIKSNGIPVRVEFHSRGVGGGRYFTAKGSSRHLVQDNTALSGVPTTTHELVCAMHLLKEDDQQSRATYLAMARDFINNFTTQKSYTKESYPRPCHSSALK